MSYCMIINHTKGSKMSELECWKRKWKFEEYSLLINTPNQFMCSEHTEIDGTKFVNFGEIK